MQNSEFRIQDSGFRIQTQSRSEQSDTPGDSYCLFAHDTNDTQLMTQLSVRSSPIIVRRFELTTIAVKILTS
jgi:hypothetical protein